MRVLLVSDGNAHAVYGGALADGFRALGHDVKDLKWKGFFSDAPYQPCPEGLKDRFFWAWNRFENKFLVGLGIRALNLAILNTVRQYKPRLVFIYRGTHVWPGTIKKIKASSPRLVVVGYNNDDPFGPGYKPYVWRHFLRGLQHYDHVFCYRLKNITDYARKNVFKTSLLRSYYVPDVNKPVPEHDDFKGDICFVGHWEDDGRDDAILALLRAGVRVRVWGTGWHESLKYKELCAALACQTGAPEHATEAPEHESAPRKGAPSPERFDIKPLYGPLYNQALCSSSMALVFLSKLNGDTYTRRCFEIPAARTLMVAEYTEDLAANLFEDGKEAVYFKTREELVDKVLALLRDKTRLKAMAAAGRARLVRDGHTAVDRARRVLAVVDLGN